MFCSRCGSELLPHAVACSQCGRGLGEHVSAIAQSRLGRHLRTLGTLWMVIGGLFMIPAIALLFFGPMIGNAIAEHHPFGAGLGPLLLWMAEGSLAILAAGGVCVGLGLIERRPWARAAALILGALAIFHPPFGTALGIYTLWVLLADEGGDQYRDLTRSS